MAEQTADARVRDYVNIQTTKDLTAYHEVDLAGYDAARKETGNVARVLAKLTQSALGDSTPAVDFTNYELIQLEVDQPTNAITITMPYNTVCYLEVTKTSAGLVTFTSGDVFESTQVGQTVIFYRIERITGDILISRIDNQFEHSFISTDVTPLDGDFSTFDHLNVKVIGKMAYIHGGFTLEVSGLAAPTNVTSFNFTFPYTLFHTYNAINLYSGLFPCTGIVTATGISIVFTSMTIDNGDIISFFINGEIPIK